MSKNTLLSSLINYVSANSSGNVTISAPSSGYALDVSGTGRFTGALTGTSITLSNSLNFTSIYGGNINGYDGTSLVPMNYSASQHQYYAGGTLKMTLLGNGNLLLGTTTDNGSKLQVTGTASFSGALSGTSATLSTWLLANDGTRQIYVNPAADFGNGSLPTIQVASNHALQFATNNALRLTISSTGAATFSSSVTATSYSIAANGSLFSSTFWGTTNQAGTGSYADWALLNSSTTRIMHNPTGTLNMVFNGNVGIGTTSPTNLLTIANNSAGTNGIDFQNYASAQVLGKIYYEQTNDTFRFVNRSTYSTGGIVFITGGDTTERMRITSDGLLQFSTTSVVPTTNNAIYSYATNGYMYIQGGSTGVALAGSGDRNNAVYVNTSINSILFHTNGAGERMRITSGGNVLIGTTSDNGANLQVNGTAHFGNSIFAYERTIYLSAQTAAIRSVASAGTQTLTLDMKSIFTQFNFTSNYTSLVINGMIGNSSIIVNIWLSASATGSYSVVSSVGGTTITGVSFSGTGANPVITITASAVVYWKTILYATAT